ncbi:MAG: MMPL family transporter [Spirochaetales bacterium]|nr:MMPL family transporter [Spirochaetales bacterium]
MKAFRFTNVLIFAIFTVLTVLAALQIPKIRIDSSTEVFIPDRHEIKQINEAMEEEFGSLDSLLLGVQTEFGEVTDPEILAIIDSITAKLKKEPLAGTVLSLTNMDYIRGTDEGIEVVPLYDSASMDIENDMKARLLDWQEAYFGTFISDDRKLAAIIIQPVENADEIEVRQLYRQISEMVADYTTDTLSFHMAGMIIIKDELNRSIIADIYWLIPLAAFLILLILFFSFKRWEAVVFPIICLLLAAIWISGIIGFFHIRFTMAGMLVPVLLLVVGSAYVIHIFSHFYVSLAERKEKLSFPELHELVVTSRKKVFAPILLAGATTAGGFLSLLSSPLGPFRMFGILSAAGVVATQIASLVLIPVLLEMRYAKGIDTTRIFRKNGKASRSSEVHNYSAIARWIGKNRFTVPLIAIAIIAITLVLVPKIRSGTDPLGFFSKNTTLRKDAAVFDRELGGTDFINLEFDTPAKGDVLDPDFLLTIEEFERYMKEISANVTAVQSLVPSIKRINRLLNVSSIPYAGPVQESAEFGGFFGSGESSGEAAGFDFFADTGIKARPEELAKVKQPENAAKAPGQLFGNSSSLSANDLPALLWQAWVSSGRNAGLQEFIRQLMAEVNYQGMAYDEIPSDPAKYGLQDNEDIKDLISQYLVLYSGNLDMMINDSLEPDKTLVTVRLRNATPSVLVNVIGHIRRFWSRNLPEGWSYELGGSAVLVSVLTDLVTQSQYYSLLAALAIVWLIVTFMFRSPLAGLLALIPVLFALAGIFMFMVIGHFNLDIITSLLASLAIGIGIDYAIHFLAACKREIAAEGEIKLAYIYRTTGKAIFINAVSVALGFSALLTSNFVPIRQMGVLFAVSMLFACLSSLLVLPWLVVRIKPRFLYHTQAVRNEKAAYRKSGKELNLNEGGII